MTTCDVTPEEMDQMGNLFHLLSYHDLRNRMSPQHKFEWRGVPIIKWPCDIHLYQEYIWELKPELIIETGTDFGGSAMFFGDMMQILWPDRDECRVISIDISDNKIRPEVFQHPRAQLETRSSLDPALLAYLREECKGRRVMVILDSDHSAVHVSKELDAYHGFVSPGSLLVVEDTNLNGNPVNSQHGPGPMESVKTFLPNHPEFVPDNRWKKMMFTWHPMGWLRRSA